MQLNHLTRTHTNATARRVGRGGKRGKTSGRGTKGQKARAGHSIRPELRDLIKKLPKRRGFGKNRARTVNGTRVGTAVVRTSVLERSLASGAEVTPKTLAAQGLLRARGGKVPPVKILADAPLTKKLNVSGCSVSANAREMIEKAGGTVA